jgi:hypothetical protein
MEGRVSKADLLWYSRVVRRRKSQRGTQEGLPATPTPKCARTSSGYKSGIMQYAPYPRVEAAHLLQNMNQFIQLYRGR